MKKRRKTHDPPPERAVCDPIGPEPHDVRVALRAQPDEDVAQIRCGFFLANKATLTSISDFFARMFDNGMAETTAAKVRVVLPDAGCAIQFCRVLSAAIHGTPNWGDGGGQPSLVVVAQVMALADQFLVPRATELYNDHIIAFFISTSHQVATYCRKVSQCPYMRSDRVMEQIHSHVAKWFNDIDKLIQSLYDDAVVPADDASSWTCFARLPMECIVRLLQRDDLVVHSENTVFTVAHAWAVTNNRTTSAKPIYAACRYEQMDAAFLATVVSVQLGGVALVDAFRTFTLGMMHKAASPREIATHALVSRPKRNGPPYQSVFVDIPASLGPNGNIVIAESFALPAFVAKGHPMIFGKFSGEPNWALTIELRRESTRPKPPPYALIDVNSMAFVHTDAGWKQVSYYGTRSALGTRKQGCLNMVGALLRVDDPLLLVGPNNAPPKGKLVDGKLPVWVQIE